MLPPSLLMHMLVSLGSQVRPEPAGRWGRNAAMLGRMDHTETSEYDLIRSVTGFQEFLQTTYITYLYLYLYLYVYLYLYFNYISSSCGSIGS